MGTTSRASATWEGLVRSGKGHFEAGSGAFRGDYSFATRFEGANGTNPEELLAASHAACFSMALSVGLEQAGTPATRISTTAHCTVDKVGDGFKVTTLRLDVRGVVPGANAAAFQSAAEAAKVGCPISGAIAGNVKVHMEARLEH
ncbi:MAG: OsmC family peroxiredoxin [Gemmatimonadales bacterium]